jgi:hypothetical protein
VFLLVAEALPLYWFCLFLLFSFLSGWSDFAALCRKLSPPCRVNGPLAKEGKEKVRVRLLFQKKKKKKVFVVLTLICRTDFLLDQMSQRS